MLTFPAFSSAMITSLSSKSKAALYSRSLRGIAKVLLKLSGSIESESYIIKTFDMFRPRSSGPIEARSKLTINTINKIFPLLVDLAKTVDESFLLSSQSIDDFVDSQKSGELSDLFKKYGSDKSTHHRYHKVYSALFQNPSAINSVFEIGLGSTSKDIVSNMGPKGKPGASLRSFREFFPNARIMGADIDMEILFEEDRIQTFHLDQLSDISFRKLIPNLPPQIDLIIDDGLHSPDANLRSLLHLVPLLSSSGCMVIEDVNLAAIPIWNLIASIIMPNFRINFIDDGDAALVVVKRNPV